MHRFLCIDHLHSKTENFTSVPELVIPKKKGNRNEIHMVD